MIRAFKLEWLKLKNYKIFWILFGLYLVAQLIITNGGVFFLAWLKYKGIDFGGVDPTIIPIYDFPDIWQNSVWIASFAKILISFIVIVSVNNELTYNTLRQNIIDGVSKKEFLLSKLSIILFIASVCTSVLFISGLITGLIYSHVIELKYIFQGMEFLIAYFLQLVLFCLFAFVVAMVIKKAGFAIVLLFLYSLVFEPIVTGILEFGPFLKGYTDKIVKFFPIYSIEKLCGKAYESPFARYFFQEIKDTIFWYEWLIAIGWGGIFLLLIYWILNKKDLKI